MTEYAINVRAVVRATPLSEDAGCEVEGWEVYDTDHGEDGSLTLRCDRLVRVEADNEEDAIERAKSDAPGIEVGGCEIDDVDLWVDPAIDVNPDFASASPAP